MAFFSYTNSPTNTFLSAFERSFENFLNHQSSPPAPPTEYVPRPRYDQNDPNSEGSISAILSSMSPSPAGSNLSLSYGETPPAIKRSRTFTTPSIYRTPGSQYQYLEKARSPLVNIDLTNTNDDDDRNGKHDFAKIESLASPSPQQPVQAKVRKHPYSCKYCQKGFRKELTLSLHQCVFNESPTPHSPQSVSGPRLQQYRSPSVSEEKPKVRRSISTTASATKTPKSSPNTVEIDVPVTLVSTELVFQEPNGLAVILGDIIELDPGDTTLEEAVIEGSQIETLSSLRSVVGDIRKERELVLPDAIEEMAVVAGLTVEDIEDIFSHITEHSVSEPEEFPWQRTETAEQRVEVESLIQETDKDGGDIKSNLNESLERPTPQTPANVSEKMIARSVSLKKFIYFNDTPQTIVGSDDDSDDDDWAVSKIKCKPCKKVFSSKLQYRKHLKTHTKSKKNVQISSGKGPQKCLEKMLTLEEF